jgi:thioredoxin 1
MTLSYSDTDPPRQDIDAQPGPVLLEFGSNDCGICAAAQPRIEQALAAHPQVRHIKIEDGRGRRLGRSFGVKLWPTLVSCRTASKYPAWSGPSKCSRLKRRWRG